MGVCCKRCGRAEHLKHGLMHGKQRYLCKGCSLTLTDTPARGKPLAMKVVAVLLCVGGHFFWGARLDPAQLAGDAAVLRGRSGYGGLRGTRLEQVRLPAPNEVLHRIHNHRRPYSSLNCRPPVLVTLKAFANLLPTLATMQ